MADNRKDWYQNSNSYRGRGRGRDMGWKNNEKQDWNRQSDTRNSGCEDNQDWREARRGRGKDNRYNSKEHFDTTERFQYQNSNSDTNRAWRGARRGRGQGNRYPTKETFDNPHQSGFNSQDSGWTESRRGRGNGSYGERRNFDNTKPQYQNSGYNRSDRWTEQSRDGNLKPDQFESQTPQTQAAAFADEENWNDDDEPIIQWNGGDFKMPENKCYSTSCVKSDTTLPVPEPVDSWIIESDDTSAAEEKLRRQKVIAWKEGYMQKKKIRMAKEEREREALPLHDDFQDYMKQQEELKIAMTNRYPPLIKDTYKEAAAVAAMDDKEVAELRHSLNKLTVSDIEGKKITSLNPVRTFAEAFQPYQKFLNVIEKHGFAKPSPVQCQLWPLIMSGRDVIGIAQTGTGKTLAYLIPGLIHIEQSAYYHSKKRDGPVALVLAPTRELAQQIHNEIAKFSVRNIKTVCVYGQGDRDEQLMALEGCDIVVATPGRLIDFANAGDVNLQGVSYFVLDEADRMLDMGFHADIMKIYHRMRIDRQVIMTSATWKRMLNFAANNMMQNAVKVNIGDLDLAAVETVKQTVIVCEEEEKDGMLFEMFENLADDDKIIVFVNTKSSADFLSMECIGKRMEFVEIMHGGLEQSDRESALRNLKSGVTKVLIATDLASRGLDVLDLTKVINLDMPRNMEEYVHRSGRTGRAGKKGEVISFVSWKDRRSVPELIEIMERSNQEVSEELRRMSGRAEKWIANKARENGGRGGRGGGGRGGGRGRGGGFNWGGFS